MKKLLFIPLLALFAFGCNSKSDNTAGTSSDSTKITSSTSAEIIYPYTLAEPYKNWQADDQKNAVTVMKMLKAWETKNLTECAGYFADSVDMRLDGYRKKLPHDSIPALLDMSWANYTSVSIKMEDWEPVISSDKKDQWVTLWYKQNWVDKKGKADSMEMINDAKMVNGKIVVFDEHIQHYPAKK